MTVLRGLLACLWVLFSLTATAMPAAAQPADMPCHMDMTRDVPDHKPAKSAPVAMPCCSQPTLAATADAMPLPARPLDVIRLSPAPVALLTSLPARLDPRPPKTV